MSSITDDIGFDSPEPPYISVAPSDALACVHTNGLPDLAKKFDIAGIRLFSSKLDWRLGMISCLEDNVIGGFSS